MTPWQLSVMKSQSADALKMVEILNLLGNKDTRQEIVDPVKKLYKNLETKKNRLDLGWFSISDLVFIGAKLRDKNNWSDFKGGELVWQVVVDRLCHYGILANSTLGNVGQEYQFIDGLLDIYTSAGLIKNVLFGTAYMIESNKAAIPAINVKSPNGDISCGSGVLLNVRKNNNRLPYILTNRHVLEGNEIIEIIGDACVYKAIGKPVYCNFADLALQRVESSGLPAALGLSIDKTVLTQVISVGYPRIASAAKQIPVVHRGEINAVLHNCKGEEFLAISNHVNPGNSGGPILTEIGFCAGIVTESGIGDFGDPKSEKGTYRSVFHFAIPASEIQKFISLVEADES